MMLHEMQGHLSTIVLQIIQHGSFVKILFFHLSRNTTDLHACAGA